MALDPIRLGTPPSGQDGDDARTAFTRCNSNFASLDAWGITGGITRTVSNYNDAIAAGFHNALQGTEANRPPNIQYGIIHVGVQVEGYLRQDVVDVVSGRSATRGFNPGTGQWSTWRQASNTDQLGTAAFAKLTTSIYDPTFARVVKQGDFGVTGYSFSLGDVGLNSANDLTLTCKVWTSPGNTGLPASNYGYLEHTQAPDGLYATQTWQQLNYSTQYRRTKQGGNWGPWIRSLANDLIVGAMSNNVNDSAVIERGSNSNGHYVRFIDGTQICWIQGAATESAGANANVQPWWGFPIGFVDLNYAVSANIQPFNSWDHYGVIGSFARATDSIQFNIRNGNTPQQFVCQFQAVGRWKAA